MTLSTASEVFARLFEAVHEGVYIGTLHGPHTDTLSANPYLKLIFGMPADTPAGEVRPFDAGALRRSAGAHGFRRAAAA